MADNKYLLFWEYRYEVHKEIADVPTQINYVEHDTPYSLLSTGNVNLLEFTLLTSVHHVLFQMSFSSIFSFYLSQISAYT